MPGQPTGMDALGADEFSFAPSLFRAHNARERLAMLAGVPATEQLDIALLAQLQGASLTQGVSVGGSGLQGGLYALRASAPPCARDRTREERRAREEMRTMCVCSELPCICSEEQAEAVRHVKPVGALALRSLEAQLACMGRDAPAASVTPTCSRSGLGLHCSVEADAQWELLSHGLACYHPSPDSQWELLPAAATDQWRAESEDWEVSACRHSSAGGRPVAQPSGWDAAPLVITPSGWAAAVDIPPWHIRLWCGATARTRTRARI